MLTDIVILSLPVLTENFISAIYKATSQAEAYGILHSFLSKDAHITVNGKNISRTDFLNELKTEKFLEQGAEVKFLNLVEVASVSPDDAGSVGTFFKVSIQEIITVFGVPESKELTASLNVDFEQDRKAKALNLVILDKTAPIILPSAPGN